MRAIEYWERVRDEALIDQCYWLFWLAISKINTLMSDGRNA